MGNRSRLFIKKKEKEVVLFEANNTLPFFWLTLIDRIALMDLLEGWKKLEALQQNDDEKEIQRYLREHSVNLRISARSLKHNMTLANRLISGQFTEAHQLYLDFTDFIQSKLNEEDSLFIDMIQFSGFYESIDAFGNLLLQEINAIQEGNAKNITFLDTNDLIGSGTGFASLSPKEFFVNTTYQEALKNRKNVSKKNDIKYSEKSLVTNLIMVLLCPVFTWVVYKMILDNGVTTGGILLGLTNIGFYIASVYGVLSQYNAFRRK